MHAWDVFQFIAVLEGRKYPLRFVKNIYIGTAPICLKEMRSCLAGIYNRPYKPVQTGKPGDLEQMRASQVSLTQVVVMARGREVTCPSAPATTEELEEDTHDVGLTDSCYDDGLSSARLISQTTATESAETEDAATACASDSRKFSNNYVTSMSFL